MPPSSSSGLPDLTANRNRGTNHLHHLFEIVFDNYNYRKILFFEELYSFCLISLSILLLSQHDLFVGDGQIQIVLEVCIKLVVYLMMILLILRFEVEIKVRIERKCSMAPQD